MTKERQLIDATKELIDGVSNLNFSQPVAFVYNPLVYARENHQLYINRYGGSRKKIIFLGMNPGPWGMAQTGIPFGEIESVRDWLKVTASIGKPKKEHPKRPVTGFLCRRSEVSGRRLWGLFRERFKTAENFFAHHYVANYCPLVFMEEGGRNRTPDKLKKEERIPLFECCDRHLKQIAGIFGAEWIVGIGGFAAKAAERAFSDSTIKVGQILHPSPASPMANQDWAGKVAGQLRNLGIWD